MYSIIFKFSRVLPQSKSLSATQLSTPVESYHIEYAYSSIKHSESIMPRTSHSSRPKSKSSSSRSSRSHRSRPSSGRYLKDVRDLLPLPQDDDGSEPRSHRGSRERRREFNWGKFSRNFGIFFGILFMNLVLVGYHQTLLNKSNSAVDDDDASQDAGFSNQMNLRKKRKKMMKKMKQLQQEEEDFEEEEEEYEEEELEQDAEQRKKKAKNKKQAMGRKSANRIGIEAKRRQDKVLSYRKDIRNAAVRKQQEAEEKQQQPKNRPGETDEQRRKRELDTLEQQIDGGRQDYTDWSEAVQEAREHYQQKDGKMDPDWRPPNDGGGKKNDNSSPRSRADTQKRLDKRQRKNIRN